MSLSCLLSSVLRSRGQIWIVRKNSATTLHSSAQHGKVWGWFCLFATATHYGDWVRGTLMVASRRHPETFPLGAGDGRAPPAASGASFQWRLARVGHVSVPEAIGPKRCRAAKPGTAPWQ